MRDLVAFKRILTTNKDFRRIWLSHMVSLIGDWLSYIAVAVISIEKGEGALAVAMVMVVRMRPRSLVASHELAGDLITLVNHPFPDGPDTNAKRSRWLC